MIKKLQSNGHLGEIEYNFIFSSENLIFEGLNFDAAPNDFYDSLFILVLGNIDVVEKAEEVLKNINEFLKFAIDVSKLSQNYTIYGERQIRETLSPGNTLFSIIEKDIHFEAVFDLSCYKN